MMYDLTVPVVDHVSTFVVHHRLPLREMRIFLETANIFFFFFKKKGNVHDFCLPTQLK